MRERYFYDVVNKRVLLEKVIDMIWGGGNDR